MAIGSTFQETCSPIITLGIICPPIENNTKENNTINSRLPNFFIPTSSKFFFSFSKIKSGNNTLITIP